MQAPLKRLLKLRALVEDSSRMELERRAAVAARIEAARARERAKMRASRDQVVEIVCEERRAEEQSQERTLEWENIEGAAWRDRQLAPLAQATARTVEQGRTEFLERRKERRQVESVFETQRSRLREEHDRRTQRDLDDWFGMKQARQTVEGQKSSGDPPTSESSVRPMDRSGGGKF